MARGSEAGTALVIDLRPDTRGRYRADFEGPIKARIGDEIRISFHDGAVARGPVDLRINSQGDSLGVPRVLNLIRGVNGQWITGAGRLEVVLFSQQVGRSFVEIKTIFANRDLMDEYILIFDIT
jgi:hypothetical protein